MYATSTGSGRGSALIGLVQNYPSFNADRCMGLYLIGPTFSPLGVARIANLEPTRAREFSCLLSRCFDALTFFSCSIIITLITGSTRVYFFKGALRVEASHHKLHGCAFSILGRNRGSQLSALLRRQKNTVTTRILCAFRLSKEISYHDVHEFFQP